MKLFRIYNGYKENSDISVLIIAENKNIALKLAEDKYREVVDEENKKVLKEIENITKKFDSIFAERYRRDLKPLYDDIIN